MVKGRGHLLLEGNTVPWPKHFCPHYRGYGNFNAHIDFSDAILTRLLHCSRHASEAQADACGKVAASDELYQGTEFWRYSFN